MIQTDTGLPGETWIMEFKYDAQKRCTTIVEKAIDSTGGVPVVTEESKYTFYYNGNETRPYKITNDKFGQEVGWHLKFDGQGKKLQDSVFDSGTGYTEVVNYSYNGNRVVAAYEVDVFGTSLTFLDTVYHDGNNITKQVNAEYSLGILGSWYESSFTYDNHPNPFYQLNINTSFFASSSYLALGTFVGLNKNNFLSETYRDLLRPSAPEIIQYQYTYDPDGYPTLIRYTDASMIGTIKYEYLP